MIALLNGGGCYKLSFVSTVVMTLNQGKILSQFSPELRNHILEFCKKISLVECDVFLLLARKAACFISILEDSGLLTLNAQVVSERVLDYDTKWLEGKDIVIIDDTVISGTSINSIIENLHGIGASKIRVHVFCTNSYWFVSDLLNRPDGESYLEKPYISLEHSASLKFCRDIVTALSVYPRPYSTDFPIYEKIRLREYHFHKIQNFVQWTTVDNTSKNQHESNIRCLTMNPKRAIFQEFYESIGISLVEYSYLKIRLYCQKYEGNDNKPFYFCRALPLVIFNPVSDTFLSQLINNICQTEHVSERFVFSQLTSGKSKLRFVQFYFAQRFFLFSFKKFQEYFAESNVSYEFNIREIELIFPPKLTQIIQKFKYAGKLLPLASDPSESFLKYTVFNHPTADSLNPLLAKNVLLEQFLKFYYDKELVARRIVKRLKKEAFQNETYSKIINRLNEGYTFGDLKLMLSRLVTSNVDQNLILSNFLDNGIDSGIVVPVTLESPTGYVSRGYRHGEEVIWGENNDKLLLVYFKKFLEVTKKRDISDFRFQKLLVLFLKMGLKGGILEEYNYLTPPPQAMNLIGVRSYLFGQVTISYDMKPSSETNFNPILDIETKGYWTSERLVDSNIMKFNESSERFEFDFDALIHRNAQIDPMPDEPADLRSESSEMAEEIAELLAIASQNKLLSSTTLVQLTSCATIHDCISSIAAEIYIFHQGIERVNNWLRSTRSRKLYTANFIESLRDYSNNKAWTAINSGREKYKDFKTGAANDAIQSISTFFAKGDSFKRRSWERYWKREIDDELTNNPDLVNLNDEIGRFLIEANVLMIYCHLITFELAKQHGEIQKAIGILDSEFDINIKKLDKINSQIGSIEGELSLAGQVTIDFVKQETIKRLESEADPIKKANKGLMDKKNYWTNFYDVERSTLNSYYLDFQSFTSEPFSFQTMLTDVNSDVLQNLSIDVLEQKLLHSIKLLGEYKDQAKNLLDDFSSLVPQWGKINPIVQYDAVIHVNCEETSKERRHALGAIVRKVLADFEREEFRDQDVATRSVVLLRPKIQHQDPSGYYIGGKGQLKIWRLAKLAGELLRECSSLDLNFQIAFYPSLEGKMIVSAFYNKTSKKFDTVHDEFQKKFLSQESQILNLGEGLFVLRAGETYELAEYVQRISLGAKSRVVENQLRYVDLNSKSHPLLKFSLNKNTPSKVKRIAIINALPKEFAATKLILDSINEDFVKPSEDSNDYIQGIIKSKRGEDIEVLVALAKGMGNNLAANAATNLFRSYPDIDDVIICGIAGGVPHPSKVDCHVRLGDIVVTDANGILQYDNIKDTSEAVIIRDTSPKPSANLIGLCRVLEAEQYSLQTPWEVIIDENSKMLKNASRPDVSKDILRIAGQIVLHPIDNERSEGVPKLHYGPIGSANTLLKNEEKRDYLRDNYGVRAVEMEGSGVADGSWQAAKGYLAVRGIVDYCNDDKGDDWHTYAAVCAAAYTKCVIKLM